MKARNLDFSQHTSLAAILTIGLLFSGMLWGNTPRTADEVIDAMISAHGGMEKWRSAATVSFEDHFLAAGQKKPSVSQVMVEQGRRRAYLDFPGSDAQITWDGKQAWSVHWKGGYPPRFLALLNYYFLNLPWLARDPGVILGEPGKGKLWEDPAEYITVKMAFEPGVGDTPDDYYILYIDPKNYRLKACEYIVTYASILPAGVQATSPHILVYDEWKTVDGLLVPTHYTVYEKDHSLYGTCEIRNWSFQNPFDTARMKMPADAVVDRSNPTATKQ